MIKRTRLVPCVFLALSLGGCACLAPYSPDAGPDVPNPSFDYVAPGQKAILVLVSGNSDCVGHPGGVWSNRGALLEDVRKATGLADDEISRHYFSWTGEEPGTGRWRCWPENNYLLGERDLVKKVAGELSSDTTLIVVGHSNGGATAALAAPLFARQGHPVDLLVTMDPVSALTRPLFGAPEPPHAKLWIDVYVSSDDEQWSFGDVIAYFGRAWNRVPGPDEITCMEGHHGALVPMWRSVVVASPKFQAWGMGVHDRLHLTPAVVPYASDIKFVACKHEPPGY